MKKTVAILGCDYEGGKIIIARSSDLDLNCAELAKEAGKLLGGGGGGKPEFAQAGGASENLGSAVKEIIKSIKTVLS
jgi:alanyl-tRNA synthetase